MLGWMKRLLGRTLRRQLVVGMVVVVATMMFLFVWDLSSRQKDAVLEQQSMHAVALVQSVATSSGVWVASRDYSGLQEIVDGLARYPDLHHAIVLDREGQVLAHTNPSRRGFYMPDMPQQAKQVFLGHDPALIDVAGPIVLAGNHIGWVRIGLGRGSIAERMANISRNGIVYALIAVVLAAVLGTLAARRLTRRLYAIQSVADAVRSGQSDLRADISGEDEAAQLARQFNGMLDTLSKREAEIVVSRDALAQSESRLNQVMEVTGEGIWDWDLRNNRVRHNLSWCRMLGLDDSYLEHPEAGFTSLLYRDDREAVVARIEDCLAGKGKYRSEHRMYRPDGQVIWVQDRGDVVERDAAGKPLRMLGSTTDITGRRQLEEELQQAYGENQAVTRAIHDVLYMLDESGRLLWWNPRLEEVTGLASEMLKGRSGMEFFVAEDRATIEQTIGRVFAEGYGEIEARMLTRQGPVWYHYNSVRVHDAQGRVLGIAGVGRDISDRMEAMQAVQRSERELKALNETLETRVLERTAEVSTSRDEAERANAAKSEFLSRMSHELRTPLNAILGFGQLLETDPDHPLTEVQAGNVHEILHGGQHLLELVNEVLDLARIESGRLEVSLEPLVIRPLIQACVSQIRPLAEQRGIGVKLELDATPAVVADTTRFKQVLLNLLSNAVKYNREGGSIRVCCTAHGERLRISVQDSGAGLASESLSRLFRPFERLETAYEGIEGTGIGLALAKRLVEAMHGEIGVDSVQGEGSTFWFELPVSASMPEAAAGTATPVAHAKPSSGRNTLLIVEDNPANLRLMQKILAKRGDIELIEATSGEIGVELAVRERPDLILLDINLPGMNGFETLEKLKEHAATRGIPVIAMTANAMPRDRARGMAAGFAEYLTKPLNVAQLNQALDTQLGSAGLD